MTMAVITVMSGMINDYDSGHHMRTSTDGDADIRQVLLTRALEGRDYVDVSK